MDTFRQGIAMAGVILAATAMLGARAAEPGAAPGDGYRFEQMGAAAPLPGETESPRFENFEQQVVAGSAQAAGYRLDVVDSGAEAAATVAPGLEKGDRVEFLVDGLPAAPASTALELPLKGIAPGPHRLQARIIDSTGNVGSVSPSISFTEPE